MWIGSLALFSKAPLRVLEGVHKKSKTEPNRTSHQQFLAWIKHSGSICIVSEAIDSCQKICLISTLCLKHCSQGHPSNAVTVFPFTHSD